MPSAPYLAPSYFAPSYFAPAYFATADSSIGERMYRDRVAVDAIIDTLQTTGAFEDVLLGGAEDPVASAAGGGALAIVTPTEWVELDGPEPGTRLHRVSFTVALVARDGDPGARLSELGQLGTEVRDALPNSDLGGNCIPEMTRMRSGRYRLGTGPSEDRAVMDGEFAYAIPAPASTPAA